MFKGSIKGRNTSSIGLFLNDGTIRFDSNTF